MKVCGPQGWEYDLQWRPKGGEIDIWKPENVKFSVGCPAIPSWGKPLIGALIGSLQTEASKSGKNSEAWPK